MFKSKSFYHHEVYKLHFQKKKKQKKKRVFSLRKVPDHKTEPIVSETLSKQQSVFSMTLLDKFQILVSTLSILKEGPKLGYYEVKSRMNGSDCSFQNLGREKIKKIFAVTTKQERK